MARIFQDDNPMIDSIKFDTANNAIVVTLDDGTVTNYTQYMAAQYVADHPDRVGDLKAMGWGV